jgi:fibronectin-binding autotransporter adhesin
MTTDHIQFADTTARALPGAPSRGRRGRRPLLLTTALGCSIAVLAGASASRAESISQNNDTGVSITVDTITGSPFAIDAYSENGAVTVTANQINVSNDLTGSGFGVGAVSMAADKLVTVNVGAINTSGTGRVFGISAQALNGSDILVSTGTVNGTGDGGYGVWAGTTSGDITLASGSVSTTGGVRSTSGGPRPSYGLWASTDSGAVSVTSNTATTTGLNAAAIIVQAGTGDVVIDSGLVSTAGVFAPGIHAQGGDITITSDQAQTTGGGSPAIWAASDTGDVSVVSGSIETTGLESNGIMVAPTPTVAYGTAAGAAGGTGAVVIDSGSVSTAGERAIGIAVQNLGAVDITSDTVTTTGLIASGIYVWGSDAIGIDSGSVSAQSGAGIAAFGLTGDIDITSGTVALGQGGDVGVYAQTSSGDVTIHASSTTTTAPGVLPGGYTADGVVGASLSGDVSITSQSVSVKGDSAYGVAGFTSAATSITSGSVTTAGEGGIGIYGRGLNGGLTIDSGSVSTQGDEAAGIWAVAGSAPVTITSDEVSTSGYRANGITIGGASWLDYGWREAAGGTGLVTIDSGDIVTTGAESWGIAVDHQGPMSITSGSITASANGGSGIYVWGDDAITIDSGDIEAETVGIVAFGDTGDIDITSDTILMGPNGDTGIYAEATGGDIRIDAGVTTMTATGFPWDMYVAHAVFGWSNTGLVHIISDNASTQGDSGVAVGARGGQIVIHSGVTLATGEVGRGVYARSHDGPVIITSASATATGDGGVGIFAVGTSGLSIDSGVASSSGDRILADDSSYIWSHAIYGQAVDGSAFVTVENTTATGSYADAVRLLAGEGGTISLGVNGAVSSSQAYGAFLATDGQISVSVAAGASVAGAYAGISTQGEGPVGIVNRGTIRNTASSGDPDVDYAAINIAGENPTGSTVTNFGSIIAGGNGPAIWFDGGDDTVNLMTGSVISGAVVGADGLDTVNLIGTSNVRTQTQSLAHFVEFEQLNVIQGYWTASGHQSEFAGVFIGANGGLEVRDFLSGGEFLSAVAAPSVVNNGLLVINFAEGSEDTEDFFVSGTGILRLSGAGTFNVNTNTIAHTGGTIIDAGKLVLTGALQGDLVINAGGTFQLGDGGTAGTFAGDILDNGTLIFDRSDNYEFKGGLFGSGSLVKKGANQLYLSGQYGFTGVTTVLGGTLKLANIDESAELEVGGGELDLSGGDHEVAGLTGEGGEVNIEGGSLTINVEGTDVFGGEITGDGDLTVSGGGTLNLTGDSTYTGDTSVQDGVLKVNGSIVSDVFITEGGTLGGNGTVGGVNVDDGGTVGPGNSIGLLNVAGDVAFGPGSFYEVEANAAGQSDRIVATGDAVLTGGTVTVLAEAGVYNRLTTYNILTAAGGITGQFDAVTSNFAYLSASLDYTDNDVLLTLARNDIAFSTLAIGANQIAVADAVEAGGEDLYDAVLFQTDAGAQQAFTALSGEFHGAAPTALLAQSRYSREAALGRLRDAEDGGSGVWGAAYGAHQTWDAGEAAAVRNHLGGVMFGADMGLGAWRLGAAVGQERSRAKAPSLGSESETQSTTLAVYGGVGAGPLSARLGVSHAWHDIEAAREVSFPTFTDSTTAELEATTTQLFGEVGYKMALGGGTFEPFANVAAARVTTDAFAETGGAAALAVEEIEREAVFSSIGARFTVQAQLPFGVASPYISVAYGNASGDLDGATANTFDTGEAFEATGASLADNALLFDTGFDWRITDAAKAGFAYQGAFGDDADEQSVRLELSIRF